jgi:hypothetical protein
LRGAKGTAEIFDKYSNRVLEGKRLPPYLLIAINSQSYIQVGSGANGGLEEEIPVNSDECVNVRRRFQQRSLRCGASYGSSGFALCRAFCLWSSTALCRIVHGPHQSGEIFVEACYFSIKLHTCSAAHVLLRQTTGYVIDRRDENSAGKIIGGNYRFTGYVVLQNYDVG